MKNIKNMKKIDWKNIDIKNSVGKLVDKVKSSDTYKRPLAIAIAAALIVSAAGAGTCSIVSAHQTKTIQAMRAYVESPDLQEQDETVYVIADADGGVKKVIVSDWQKDSSKNNTIADVKTLEELEQSDAENGYSLNTDTANSWDAGSSTYQNVSTGSDLPIDVQLSYSLDGQKMTANEIAGKSGKVTIRFDYTNNQKQTVSIDGKNTDIYVPFTVVTGTIFDSANFQNVKVSNGKVINDGSRSIVMGFALPGMQESLGLDGGTPDLPSDIEITADVTNFELTTTLTMVSNDFFNQAVNDAEEKKQESSSNLSLDSLSAGINQLVDGSAALYDGTGQLLDKSGLLIDGINQLADGSQQLEAGVVALNAGLQTLCSNNSTLNAGAESLFDGLLNSVNPSLARVGALTGYPLKITRENYAGDIQTALTVIGAAKKAKNEEQTALVKQLAALGISTQNIAAIQSQSNEILAAAETDEANDTAQETVNDPTSDTAAAQTGDAAAEETVEPTEQAQEQPTTEESFNEEHDTLSGNGSVDTSVTTDTNDRDSTEETTPASAVPLSNTAYEKAVELATVAQTVAMLDTLETTLMTYQETLPKLEYFCTGLQQYTAGVKSAADGAGQLEDGANRLTGGISQLQSGSDALVDGITQLNNGAMQLSEGMQQLSGSHLAKLLGASSGVSLSDVNARFDAMRDVSAAYNSYTGNADSTGVKFIYRTDSISADLSK